LGSLYTPSSFLMFNPTSPPQINAQTLWELPSLLLVLVVLSEDQSKTDFLLLFDKKTSGRDVVVALC